MSIAAHPLRLDYMGLKRRLEGLASPEKKAAAPAFVELITALPAMVAECVIEFESRIGSKFIDPERFRGTCYRAANWVLMGRTTGRVSAKNAHSIYLPVARLVRPSRLMLHNRGGSADWLIHQKRRFTRRKCRPLDRQGPRSSRAASC